mgnify:FL=1
MGYLQYTFSGIKDAERAEQLIAELLALSFEGFLEEKDRITAYIREDNSPPDVKQFISELPSEFHQYKLSIKHLEEINWNSAWEKSFQPITIADQIYLRAPFHAPNPEAKYDLVIEPKMSFGTGHHQTTRLMMEAMLCVNFDRKVVLDMGTGTGVLAIFASLLGAERVLGLDIDNWSLENARYNVLYNSVGKIQIDKRDNSTWGSQKFDIVLANIDKNVLLKDLKYYQSVLTSSGILIISGLLGTDNSVIEKEAFNVNLNIKDILREDEWIALILTK